jgi:hypothetical protein
MTRNFEDLCAAAEEMIDAFSALSFRDHPTNERLLVAEIRTEELALLVEKFQTLRAALGECPRRSIE